MGVPKPAVPSLKDPFRPSPMRLNDLPVGATGRVCGLSGETDTCSRLREMGFCESAVIEKIAGERTLLCQLCGTRIALSDRAAAHILVELIRGGI
jgi:ferrous iron transport protein A